MISLSVLQGKHSPQIKLYFMIFQEHSDAFFLTHQDLNSGLHNFCICQKINKRHEVKTRMVFLCLQKFCKEQRLRNHYITFQMLSALFQMKYFFPPSLVSYGVHNTQDLASNFLQNFGQFASIWLTSFVSFPSFLLYCSQAIDEGS